MLSLLSKWNRSMIRVIFKITKKCSRCLHKSSMAWGRKVARPESDNVSILRRQFRRRLKRHFWLSFAVLIYLISLDDQRSCHTSSSIEVTQLDNIFGDFVRIASWKVESAARLLLKWPIEIEFWIKICQRDISALHRNDVVQSRLDDVKVWTWTGLGLLVKLEDLRHFFPRRDWVRISIDVSRREFWRRLKSENVQTPKRSVCERRWPWSILWHVCGCRALVQQIQKSRENLRLCGQNFAEIFDVDEWHGCRQLFLRSQRAKSHERKCYRDDQFHVITAKFTTEVMQRQACGIVP